MYDWQKLANEVRTILVDSDKPNNFGEPDTTGLFRNADQPRTKWPRFRKKKKTNAKPFCATKPVWKVKRGKGGWRSVVKYKKPDGSVFAMVRIVGRTRETKPKPPIEIRGKRLPWCPEND